MDWQRVCVSVRERGGEREKLRERGRETKGEGGGLMTGNLYLDWQMVCVSVRERGEG